MDGLHVEPASVTLPGVLPLTHVIWRCNRFGVYIRWLNRGTIARLGPKQVRSQWDGLMSGRVQQTVIKGESCPVNMGEALETGRCIAALPEEMREAIYQEHVIGGTQQEKADYLKIDRTTFWRRCERAYPRLLEFMNLAAAGLPLE